MRCGPTTSGSCPPTPGPMSRSKLERRRCSAGSIPTTCVRSPDEGRRREEHVMEHYLVISADCHAGLPNAEYRDWLDPEFRQPFYESQAARAAVDAELA